MKRSRTWMNIGQSLVIFSHWREQSPQLFKWTPNRLRVAMGKSSPRGGTSHGGRRAGAGRKKKHVQVMQASHRTPRQVRVLLGLDRRQFKTKSWDARCPVTFLTVATVVFFFTRTLMDFCKDSAVDWKDVAVSFAEAEAGSIYEAAVCALAMARNGMKRLKFPTSKLQNLRQSCRAYIGSHCSLPEIMFCTRIHPMKPTLQDPFTESTVTWLREVIDPARPLSQSQWATMIAFGKLRQQAAVRLLTPSHPSYLGFSALDSPAKLGSFIAAQDSVQWNQQLTQEMSKVAGRNSARASVGLANLWPLLAETGTVLALSKAMDYHGLVQVLQELPGHGPFIAKNIAETVCNAIQLTGLDPSKLGPHLQEVMADYSNDPKAVLGPGPLALGRFFFGQSFGIKDFELVRSSVNRLCQEATVVHKGRCHKPGTLTGPQMQALWCKLKGSLDDYCTQTLGQHARK